MKDIKVMAEIKENLKSIRDQIEKTALDCGRNPQDITLIAVSKKKPVEAIVEAIQAGSIHFGENYIQEAMGKIDGIKNIAPTGLDSVCWHFIGHLQSNKSKFAVKYFDYIHTVDSLKLAKEINKQAKKIDKVQKILLQINIGMEDTKSGIIPEKTVELAEETAMLENLSIEGLMGMPPFSSDPEDVRGYFKNMVEIKKEIEHKNYAKVSMYHLSMGMSSDYEVAIQEGSTMVRVGTSIFGRR